MKNNRIISLQDIIADIKDEKYIKEKILKQFKSRERNSIEDFQHNKAINFEKSSLSATHLIRNDKSGEILGYFTFANKSLIIEKENFLNLSKTQQKRFSQSGRKLKTMILRLDNF